MPNALAGEMSGEALGPKSPLREGPGAIELAAHEGRSGADRGLDAVDWTWLDRMVGETPFVPTISTFYGIVIQMFWRDHAPPHFHALYAEHEAVIDIRDLSTLRGSLPSRAAALVLEWAGLHQGELVENWTLCSQLRPPKPIEPLK